MARLANEPQLCLCRALLLGSTRQPTHASSAGLEVSPGDQLKHLFVQARVRHQLLEPGVLLLRIPELLRLVDPQPAVLLPPAVVRLLRDAQALATSGIFMH